MSTGRLPSWLKTRPRTRLQRPVHPWTHTLPPSSILSDDVDEAVLTELIRTGYRHVTTVLNRG